MNIVNKSEKEELINKKTVLVKPTSGNTGIGLTLVAASRGYKLILTMPDTVSLKRIKLSAILGAEIILAPRTDGMNKAITKIEELLEEIDNTFSIHQFSNPANVETHYDTTAEEIWKDTEDEVDIIIAGVGTGGTLIRIAKKLKEDDKNPDLKVIAVESASSSVLSGKNPGPHKIRASEQNSFQKFMKMI